MLDLPCIGRRFVVCAVSLGLAAIVAACGSGTSTSNFLHGDAGDAAGKIDASRMVEAGILRNRDGGGLGSNCTPLTCEKLAVNCGMQGNGCGGMLDCGSCTAPQTCGGGTKPSVCGGDKGCVPTTCAAQKVDCGPIGDGCGNVLQCGNCENGQKCGVSGTPGVCATPEPAPDAPNPCKPKTCSQLGIDCGPAGDGCGGKLACGGCESGTCGGGGKASKCGSPTPCVKKTCAGLNANCGTQADGCGGTLECGIEDGGGCPVGETCGGGGTENQCGAPKPCVPKSCEQQNIFCGPAGDGCGNTLNCYGEAGACPAGETCGGGGPSKCGTGSCKPATCASLGANCGVQADGCGGTVTCGVGDAGTCPTAGQTCGGGGTPNQCGTPPGMCMPATCASLGNPCGVQPDGCGGTVNGGVACVTCMGEETCGGGGTPNHCGVPGGCVAATCASLNANCGEQADGCGGTISCWPDGGACPGGETCGGGGTLNQCGSPTICVPLTCASFNPQPCGVEGDGCGGTINNGNPCVVCTGTDTCGGAGTPNACGTPACTDVTCAQLHANCGTQTNGCGGTQTCGPPGGVCAPGTTCGGGGTPNQCGAPACTPTITSCPGSINCGFIANGCGGTVSGPGTGGSCGDCTAPQTCGGAGQPNVCGGYQACIPTTCHAQGWNCGLADDGCGNIINCGGGGTIGDAGYDAGPDAGIGCTSPQVCGGGGIANVCGPITACTGLCLDQQVTCDGGTNTTSLSGTIYGPNGVDPLYNATVYIPNGAAGAPTYGVTVPGAGVVCGCEALTGDPLVQTTTGVNGQFTLTDVPAGVPFAIVIQLGRWQREVTIPAIPACTQATTTSAAVGGAACTGATAQSGTCLTSLPTIHNQPNSVLSNIPLTAIVTGSADEMECVFLAMGIQSSEFGNPGGANRISLYKGDYSAGAHINSTTPSENTLWDEYGAGAPTAGGLTNLENYDLVVFSCQGPPSSSTLRSAAGVQKYLIDYANAGGRVFLSHYNYIWLWNDTPFSLTADWDVNQTQPTNQDPIGYINTSFARGNALAQWLQLIEPGDPYLCGGVACPFAEIPIAVVRHDFNLVYPPSLLWMAAPETGGTITLDGVDDQIPMEMTFDTPVNVTDAASPTYCGRVEFEDYHVENTEGANPATDTYNFPGECPAAGTAMTPQQKLLEFQLFDLTSCVGGQPTCTPLTCANAGPGGTALNCGLQANGCGGLMNCGSCVAPETCGGGGIPGVCGGTTCMAATCTSLGLQCGSAGDGCGNTLNCPPCEAGTACVGGQCVVPGCTALTCANAGPLGAAAVCGQLGNGCGGLTPNCGTCPAGQECTASGTCITPGSCVQLTCMNAGPSNGPVQCGSVADGCGGTLNCGGCDGSTCGGGGTPNVCGNQTCVPATCASLNATCGTPDNGCGTPLPSCGTCTVAGQSCGGGGVPNQCGGNGCTKTTCAKLGFNCGPAADGCGGVLQCGGCDGGTCGGGGVPSVCGSGTCTPETCKSLGFNCGPAGDGCGHTLQCGGCDGGTCGGGGVPSVCGGSTCVPATCDNAGAGGTAVQCGTAADGCGDALDCGGCDGGTCGGGGTPNVCGSQTCVPQTCAEQGIGCGPAGDGCGNAIQCPACTPPDTCGGGGVSSQCGSSACVPVTCLSLGYNCGPAGNGCGGEIASCGTCQPGYACGAGGQPGVCGPLDAAACVPQTCAEQGIGCGPAGDGCGNEIQCPMCTAPATCGGGGVAGQCGTSGCKPETCASQNINCGPAGDGCGGSLSCGTCTSPDTCGGGGISGQCGTGVGVK